MDVDTLLSITQLHGKVATDEATTQTHGEDGRFGDATAPEAVVYAESTEDVVALLTWAHQTETAVIPFGAGTAEEGFLAATRPSVSLDLSRMNSIIEVRERDFQVVVQPGIRRLELNEALADTGLMFPVDPGSNSSIGGMASTNASGTTTVRYGGMRQNVIAMKVVLADGRVLSLGRPVRKSSSGYDLKDLFIGAAGTLGVIVELTLALQPIPEHVSVVQGFFPSTSGAAAGAYAVMAAGSPVERLELLDALGVDAVNKTSGSELPAATALWIGIGSASQAAVAGDISRVAEICTAQGAIEIRSATRREEVDALWEIRHGLAPAVIAQFPGRRYKLTDTAVPLSRLVEMVDFASEEGRRLELDVIPAGHVGDGNVHVMVAIKPGQEGLAEEYSDAVVLKALELDGTATGEHGIGIAKRRYMRFEHGEAVDIMWDIKRAIDPRGIMNPGKVLPEPA